MNYLCSTDVQVWYGSRRVDLNSFSSLVTQSSGERNFNDVCGFFLRFNFQFYLILSPHLCFSRCLILPLDTISLLSFCFAAICICNSVIKRRKEREGKKKQDCSKPIGDEYVREGGNVRNSWSYSITLRWHDDGSSTLTGQVDVHSH